MISVEFQFLWFVARPTLLAIVIGILSSSAPAGAQYGSAFGIGGGTTPVYHPYAPRMETCNPTASEECRRLKQQRATNWSPQQQRRVKAIHVRSGPKRARSAGHQHSDVWGRPAAAYGPGCLASSACRRRWR
jgi:hypothetical protein